MSKLEELGFYGPYKTNADGSVNAFFGEHAYHIHPEATADIWSLLQDDVINGVIELLPYNEPVITEEMRLEALRSRLKKEASFALKESDTALLKYVESATSVPASLIEYRKALKRISTGEDAMSEVLPDVPDTSKITSVTARQAKLALLEAGYYSAVEAAISAIEDPIVKKASQIEWEYAATVDRDSSFTQGMATALGLTEQDMDNLFMLAWSK